MFEQTLMSSRFEFTLDLLLWPNNSPPIQHDQNPVQCNMYRSHTCEISLKLPKLCLNVYNLCVILWSNLLKFKWVFSLIIQIYHLIFFSFPRPVRVRHVTNLFNVGSLSHKMGVLVKYKSVENHIVYITKLLPTNCVPLIICTYYVHLIIVQFVHIITVHIPVDCLVRLHKSIWRSITDQYLTSIPTKARELKGNVRSRQATWLI